MASRPRGSDRLDRLLDAWEPEVRQAFLDAVYAQRAGIPLDQLIALIEAGDIDNAIRAVGLNPANFRSLDRAIASAYEAGGQATASNVPAIASSDGLRTAFVFNIRNLAAEAWLSEHSSTLVREIIDDQRIMVRQFLEAGLARGDNPRTTALDLIGRVNSVSGRREGGTIGLTASQEAWVRNYEAELRSIKPLDALTRNLRDKRFDAAVKRAAASGLPIPDGQITAMVTNYRNRALRLRAETIGRTETLRSLHEAQKQSLAQAVAQGLDPDTIRQVWRTSRDARVRDLHRSMEGQTRPYGQDFEDGEGNSLAFPGDPRAPARTTIQCRCWVEPVVDFLSNIE